MIRFSAQARKYLIALGGVGLLVACNRLGLEIPGLPDLIHFDINIPGLPEIIRDVIIAIVATEGVFRIANKAQKPGAPFEGENV